MSWLGLVAGKGWYNLNERNYETYCFSKMRSLLAVTRFMMEDTLRSLVMDNQAKFVAFVAAVCSAKVSTVLAIMDDCLLFCSCLHRQGALRRFGAGKLLLLWHISAAIAMLMQAQEGFVESHHQPMSVNICSSSLPWQTILPGSRSLRCMAGLQPPLHDRLFVRASLPGLTQIVTSAGQAVVQLFFLHKRQQVSLMCRLKW